MGDGASAASAASSEGVLALEAATRDLVGLALRSVEQQDVSLPQFRLLLVLRELGPASSTRCAEELGVVGSSVTRLAVRLDASGHLVRSVDPDNRSVITLSLTDTGRAVVDAVTAFRRRELGGLLDRLEPEQRRACTAALQAIHTLLAHSTIQAPPHRLPL